LPVWRFAILPHLWSGVCHVEWDGQWRKNCHSPQLPTYIISGSATEIWSKSLLTECSLNGGVELMEFYGWSSTEQEMLGRFCKTNDVIERRLMWWRFRLWRRLARLSTVHVEGVDCIVSLNLYSTT